MPTGAVSSTAAAGPGPDSGRPAAPPPPEPSHLLPPPEQPRQQPLPRIAVDLRALVPEPTGIGVYTRSLALELARRGGMRYLGLAHRPPLGAAELAAAGIEIEPAAGVIAAAARAAPALPLGVAWQQLLLPLRLARGDVDLLWSPLLTLPLRCPVPGVVTVHDLTVLLMPEAHRAKVRWSLLPFLGASLRGARRVVAVSRATAADVAFHFPGSAGKLRVIYNGVDDEFRPGTAEEIAATRAELGAPEGYLLYAGTLEPRKNVGALLDAWEALAAADPRFPPLVLAGPYGWGSRGLARRIARLAAAAPGSRLLPLGRLDRARLVRVFQAARLFVYPSLYEGFGLPPAEALACGVPAVVLDSSSLPEVVGDAGVLVAPGDSAALAAALGRLVAEPERVAELAGRAVEQAGRFRWQRAAAEMEEVFQEALG
jgi:glycosyltransferase involved in cell wall biosynthesis